MDKLLFLQFLASLSFLLVLSLAGKPNIVLVLTDDQDLVLGGMQPLKKVQTLISDHGATLTNFFASSPLCCPSRASLLTGLYPHNHKTINNSLAGGCYAHHWRKNFTHSTFPVALQRDAGYRTFYAGKYLNKYHGTEVPPGFDQFFGLLGNSRYFNFSLNENGVLKDYFDGEYFTDVLSDLASAFLNEQTEEKPFFAMISPPSPHAPFEAAERHQNAFPGLKAPRTKNFNVGSGPLEKHWLLTMAPKQLPEAVVNHIDEIYRKRWQTLLAVDDLVGKIGDILAEKKLLDNTYIIFTSDNGYHMGQFAQPYDKRQPYETDIRVPFLIRGPKIAAKTTKDVPSVMVDLAPTILELAGLSRPENLDGVSIASHLFDDTSDGLFRQILIEHWGEGNLDTYSPQCPYDRGQKLTQCTLDAACHCQDSWNNTFQCIRRFASQTDFLFCEFNDREHFIEAYDLSEDEYQLNNIAYFEMLPSERAIYSLNLSSLKTCTGSGCHVF